MSDENALIGRDFDGFRMTIRTPQVRQVLQGLQQVELIPATTPKIMRAGWEDIEIPDKWFETLSTSQIRRMTAQWGEDVTEQQTIYVKRGEVITAASYLHRPRLDVIYRLLEDAPFTEAVFPGCYDEWSERLDGQRRYNPPGFGDGHGTLGWACAFKGAGHARLVSRRWLDYGPWLLLRGPGDLSLVLFHDMEADWQTALDQARPAHRRMGISDVGGYIQHRFPFVYEWSGFYEPEDQTYRVIVPPDETIEQDKMLEACAIRFYDHFGQDKPVEHFRFLFLDEADARRHLHELWLRDLQCWAIVDGEEVRLDADYAPEPQRPEWVERLDERLEGHEDWVIGDMSAYA